MVNAVNINKKVEKQPFFTQRKIIAIFMIFLGVLLLVIGYRFTDKNGFILLPAWLIIVFTPIIYMLYPVWQRYKKQAPILNKKPVSTSTTNFAENIGDLVAVSSFW